MTSGDDDESSGSKEAEAGEDDAVASASQPTESTSGDDDVELDVSSDDLQLASAIAYYMLRRQPVLENVLSELRLEQLSGEPIQESLRELFDDMPGGPQSIIKFGTTASQMDGPTFQRFLEKAANEDPLAADDVEEFFDFWSQFQWLEQAADGFSMTSEGAHWTNIDQEAGYDGAGIGMRQTGYWGVDEWWSAEGPALLYIIHARAMIREINDAFQNLSPSADLDRERLERLEPLVEDIVDEAEALHEEIGYRKQVEELDSNSIDSTDYL